MKLATTVYAVFALFITLALPACADSPLRLPADQVSSYALVIASSGEDADVYYPTPGAAADRGNQIARAQHPVVLMMQGANVNKEYYSVLAVGVARQGFVVVVPDQRNRLFNNALRFAEMHTITEVLEQMRLETNNPDSPIYGAVDTSRLAIMGHSFGGGATMFAVAAWCTIPFCDETIGFVRPPELKAVVLTSSNSEPFDFDTTGVPIMIISGTLERGRENQQKTYANLEPPRAFVSIEGGTHYGMCDADVPPGARPLEGEPEQLVPNGVTAARYAHWAGTFLRAHVLDDPQALREIYRNRDDYPGVEVTSLLP